MIANEMALEVVAESKKLPLAAVYEAIQYHELYAEDGWPSVDEMTISPMFHVKCDGAITIDLVCCALAWKMDGGECQAMPTPTIAAQYSGSHLGELQLRGCKTTSSVQP